MPTEKPGALDLTGMQRAVRWYPPAYDIRVEAAPIPQIIDPDDAIVRVTLAGLCGSDLHIYRGHEDVDSDLTCGHEIVGEVVALGSSFHPQATGRPELYSTLRVGDKVVSPFTVSCGECHFCRIGFTCRCVHSCLFGIPSLPGGQAQFVRIPKAGGTLFSLSALQYSATGIANRDLSHLSDSSLILLADILPTGVFAAMQALQHPKLAPMLTAKPYPFGSHFLARTSSQGQAAAALQSEDRILTIAVVGLGPVGICATISLLDVLASLESSQGLVYQVIAIDPLEARRNKMQAIYDAIDSTGKGGGRFAIASIEDGKNLAANWTNGAGCNAVLEIVGNNSALTLAYEVVRPFGIISSVGVHQEPPLPFNGRDVYNKNEQNPKSLLTFNHYVCLYPELYRTPILDIMSNSLQQLVPVLDGLNYTRWAELMKAYLQQQEVWYVVELPAGITAPTLQEDGSNRNEVIAWTMTQSKAMGSIRLRLNDEVAKLVKDATTAKKLWDDLKDLYGTTSALGAYSFYKAAVGTRIPPNEHPGPAIAKIQGNLDQLEGAGINIPANLRALMILDAAPSRYETAIQLCLNDNDLSELTTSAAREALVASWEATTTRGNRNKAGEAKKLSAIKRKGKDPSFKQQQQQQRHQNGDGSSQQQQQKKGKARRGKRKSQKSSDHDHTHLVSPATISDGPTSTVDPRALLRKPVQVNGLEGESKYPTLKRAFNLARELDVTPSIERIRALEGVIKAADKGEGTSRIIEVPSDSDSADSHSSKQTRLTLAERIDWTERDDDAESAISLGNEDEDVDMEIAQAAGLYEQYDEQVRSDL
ncbi:hypothetical protein ACG7TL_009305 [Trametes sanguinea]